jgi:hypothetical protein
MSPEAPTGRHEGPSVTLQTGRETTAATAPVQAARAGARAFGPPRWGWASFTGLTIPGRWPGLAWGCHVVAEGEPPPLLAFRNVTIKAKRVIRGLTPPARRHMPPQVPA